MTKKNKKKEVLIEKWQTRQAELAHLLVAGEVLEKEPHVDWQAERLEWINKSGEMVVTAQMKPLCRYASQDELVTILDLNQLSQDFERDSEQIDSCDRVDAWWWAMRLAESSQAEYLYSIGNHAEQLFMGLYDLESSDSKENVARSDDFALEVLQEVCMILKEKQNDPAYVRRFFINHAESLWRRAMLEVNRYKDELYIRKKLIEMANTFGRRRFRILPAAPLSEAQINQLTLQLDDLRAHWIKVAPSS